MIHLTEKFPDKRSVEIDVGGVIDQAAIPVLQAVCERHLTNGMRVALNLESVIHITREGRGFIQGMRERVSIANIPEFMKLEQGN